MDRDGDRGSILAGSGHEVSFYGQLLNSKKLFVMHSGCVGQNKGGIISICENI